MGLSIVLITLCDLTVTDRVMYEACLTSDLPGSLLLCVSTQLQ